MADVFGYLAIEGLEEELERELVGVKSKIGRLFLAEGPLQQVHWVQNIWQNPQTLSFSSISDAAQKLRALQALWAFYPHHLLRKGELITSQLPYRSSKPLKFPSPLPKAPIGSWVLIDDKTLLASPVTSSPFPLGEIRFQETALPPSRAYLKLWEVFTLMGEWPKPGDTCFEIGASPGGWSWALLDLGAKVTAVDRAPLELPQHPNLSFLQKDAFKLPPAPADWILSDAACYPEKLLEWVLKWIETNPLARFICTLKFQGKAEMGIVKEFEKIAGGRVLHLHHNKHELTFYKK
jgi:23S rRNA (cytidine2498-2'-O)-methyltransferase